MGALQSANAKLALAFAGGVLLASSVFFLFSDRSSDSWPEPPGAPPPPVVELNPVVPEPPEPEPPPAPAKPKPERRAAPRKPVVTARSAPPPPQSPPPPVVHETAPAPSAPAPSAPAAPAAPERPQLVMPEAHLPTAPFAPPPERKTVTIAQGTLIPVRLEETLDSSRNIPGDAFRASLAEPLVVDGWVIAERGARIIGHVADVEQSGRLKGLASLSIELTSLTTSDGQKVDLETARFSHQAATSKKSDAAKVGIGAAIGAVIGGIAGGGKGAAIGAATGGAAGAGTVAVTRGNAAVLEAETRISFLLQQPVTLTERQ